MYNKLMDEILAMPPPARADQLESMIDRMAKRLEKPLPRGACLTARLESKALLQWAISELHKIRPPLMS
jgi:hypothetical protein